MKSLTYQPIGRVTLATPQDGWKTSYTTKHLTMEGKDLNRKVKMENGNGQIRHNATVLQWNMGSKLWLKKKSEIENVLQQYRPEIFIITEANLKEELNEYERKIPGYDLLLPKTMSEHKIARIVVLVKEGVQIKLMEQFMDNMVSAIWFKIGTKGNKPMLVGAVYREHQHIYQIEPNNSGLPSRQNQRWFKFVDSWRRAAATSDVMVMGDINLDLVKWNSPDWVQLKMVNKVKDEIETLGFQQVIKGTTRSWPGVPDSSIDHCWMNSPGRVIFTRNVVRKYSDHNLTLVCFRTKNRIEDRHEYVKRERKNMNLDNYKQDIASIDWSELLASQNIEEVNSIFEEKITKVLDKHAPVKKFQKRKKSKKWVSQKLKEDMKIRDQLWKTAKDSGRLDHWESYKVSRNECVRNLEKCKEEYHRKLYKKIENERTTKNLYRLTSELFDKRDGCTPQQYVKNGNIIRKPIQMANLQMEYYDEKIKNLTAKIPRSSRNPLRYLDSAMSRWQQRDEVPFFKFRPVTVDEMNQLISSLSESTALGHDNLDSISLKSVAPLLIRPLIHIVNTSLMTSKFARKWKFARLTPRLKSKELDRNCISSYRPVAVLTTTSKLVEKAGQQQLLTFLETTRQLNKSNHAYRKHHSTTTTLTEISDEIYEGAETKRITALMTLDQSAAFDCVSHGLLLAKLRRYKLSTEAIAWIKDYLQERTQYVVIGGAHSRMYSVNRGVPQGSVIGPLLYALFTNEMTEVVKSAECQDISHNDYRELFGQQCSKCGVLSIYADDSTYAISSRTRTENQERLRTSLEELTKFLNDNGLKINQSKTSLTECMLKQKRSKLTGHPPKLEVQDEAGNKKTIQNKKYLRILGANLQGNLGWTEHLEGGEKALVPRN